MKNINLSYTWLTTQQVERIFAVIDKERNTELSTLFLANADLSTVDPNVLVGVVVRLKNVILSYTDLSHPQVETMFAVLNKEKNAELHTLNLHGVNLSTVDPDVLDRVVVRFNIFIIIRGQYKALVPKNKLI